MRINKIYSLFEYTAWILKKYSQLPKNQLSDIYRICEVVHTTFQEPKIIAQVVGKSACFECTPQEVVESDWLLEGFSKKEVRMITYLAYQHMHKPKYQIFIQRFSENRKKMIFTLKKLGTDIFISKTAAEISLDKTLINELQQEDVLSIGYVAGYEQSI